MSRARMSQGLAALPAGLGVIIVDHGSRRSQSNQALVAVVQRLAAASPGAIVEPAHMELAEPSIDTAVDRCVGRGASQVVIQPFFLLPGRHWQQDLPRLIAAAARRHPGVRLRLGKTLGGHELLDQVIAQRIRECLAGDAGAAASAATQADHDQE